MIGYHASHEQYPPSELLRLVQKAQEAGFQAASCSDHFHPWSEEQGQSGFAWSWLGAALQATALPMGVITAPGWRYHPAILAQACATLGEMFPDRFWVALGSGEILNEGIVGGKWPPKQVRNEILYESVEIIRSLWAGEEVTRSGLIRVEEAKLHTLPKRPPLLIGAAITPETAQWVGGWADGLITIAKAKEEMAQVVEAFRRGGGEGKPMFLQAQHSYGSSEETALRGAWEEWKTAIFESSVLAQLRTPAEFKAVASFVTPEDMREYVRISPEVEKHVQWLREDREMGFQQIYVHNVNREQEHFIRDFGEKVLPVLTPSAS
jgi:coenzyme F420-dependent glucose-6-phosphate dehydrogenase